ncbi:MAG: tetratricopeptide repeat protein, partial [Microcoleaceae cyanobacterium]
RNSILRFCDRQYQFHQGIDFTENVSTTENVPNVTNTIRVKWNNLNETLKNQLSQVVNFAEFNTFAEPTTQDYPQLLSRLKCQINLERKIDSVWDPAFHLYSCLAFLKNQKRN